MFFFFFVVVVTNVTKQQQAGRGREGREAGVKSKVHVSTVGAREADGIDRSGRPDYEWWLRSEGKQHALKSAKQTRTLL